MKNTKHTIEPWQLIIDAKNRASIETKDMILFQLGKILSDMDAANARLCAAAPELLEALQACRNVMWEGNAPTTNQWREAELKSYRAVRKALGES